ncbi:ABC transporter ATP-binding protein [Lactococcus hodotermopsidis]|uniref:ABC transporter ATP-binding protein n=1 Tax=Pseudolactococcus hodotermopsidis TaxID=2709157 RepID=A0A6A0BAG6_9LACT|nr:ABC transporter ATP-binding protein [Lactococcus hodotermopsidis]GFH42419.1 ABC transporter ATP-binding protein [Lactococcus hodotermopsidis]
MRDNIAVKVENVKKSFRLPTESTNSLRTALVNYFRGIKGYREQEVLKDISFEVEKGDFFGIVGRNGSGKSTLLKIISEIYVPEHGKVEIDGRLVSFIELGVGFNPELTGIENVYLNGALLGFSTEEVDEMYDEIVDFAELHDFMNQKLKNYSSGMQVRLAFSVAIQAKSDILVLDEILAVGDEAFQRKCNEYFLQAKKEGKTIILVTHDMSSVRKYCNKAIMIKEGEVIASGEPAEVAAVYTNANFEKVDTSEEDLHKKNPKYKTGCNEKVPTFELELLSKEVLSSADELSFKISYDIREDVPSGVGFSIIDLSSGGAFSIIDDGCVAQEIFIPWTQVAGIVEKTYTLPLNSFNNRDFKIVATVFTGTSMRGDYSPIAFIGVDRGLDFFVRDDNGVFGPLLKEQGRFS